MRAFVRFRHRPQLALLLLALLIGVAVAGCHRKGNANTLKPIRFCVNAGASTTLLEFAIEKGVFRDSGIDLRLRYGGGSQGNVAIAAGDVDAGAYGSPLLTAVIRGLRIKLVAATAPPRNRGSVLAGRPEIRRVEDLRGKVIAGSGKGNGPYQQMMVILRAHGLREGDFKLFPSAGSAGASATLQLMKTGQVDAATFGELDLALAESQGIAHPLDTSGKYQQIYQSAFVFVHQDLIDRDSQTVRKLVGAFFDARRFASARFEEYCEYSRKKYGKAYPPDAFRRSLKNAEVEWGDGSIDTAAVHNALRSAVEWGDYKPEEIRIPDDRFFDLRFLPPGAGKVALAPSPARFN